jgi:L-fuconolactonase
MSLKIDAHQHFWRLKRGDYGWLTPDLTTLYRDFVPTDLIPLLMRNGIDQTILVQAAPTESETHFLLGLAEVTPFIAGVVGWTDFELKQSPYRIADLARNSLLVGLRPMVQDLPDPLWLTKPALAPAFEAMIKAGLVFDALVLPHHLAALSHVLTRHSDLVCVIDHVAKPKLQQGVSAEFWDEMKNLARHPHCYCKLSGLLTEAAPGATLSQMKPIFTKIHHLFGSERLIWGSDWPVLTQAASYDDWFAMAHQMTKALKPTERDAIFGLNAKQVYLKGRGRTL